MIIKPSPFELPFAALLAYSPRGRAPVSVDSRTVVQQLKQNRVVNVAPDGTMPIARYIAQRIARELPRTPFPSWFADAVLVPVPRSSMLSQGALWPAWQLASEMHALGIGRTVAPCLARFVAVPKSAFAGPGERPTPTTHRNSMRLERPLPLNARRVVLVDDVVTRGGTLAGAAMRLAASAPTVEIAAFAAVRTLGLQPEIEKILDPCCGFIRVAMSGLTREP